MFINGITDYDRNGNEVKTGLVIAKATCDGDIRITSSGKEVGSISVRAYGRKDGTAAFLTVKGWGTSGPPAVRYGEGRPGHRRRAGWRAGSTTAKPIQT